MNKQIKIIAFTIAIVTTSVMATSIPSGTVKKDTPYQVAKKALLKVIKVTATKDELPLIAKFEKLRIFGAARFPVMIEDIRKINKSDYQARAKIAMITKGKISINTIQMTILDNGTHVMYGGEIINTKSLEREFLNKPFSFNDKYYDKKRLLFGNANAKNKLIIFSDPLCKACIQVLPPLLNSLKAIKDVAVYYYDFPLSMHPTARTIIAATNIAHKQGKKNIHIDVYSADFGKLYKEAGEDVYKTKSSGKALKIFNKHFGTKITMKQVLSKENMNYIKDGYDAGIANKLEGTPHMIFNGEIDSEKRKLHGYLSGTLKKIERVK